MTIPTDGAVDGAPVRTLSGAVHYFRSHPRQWPGLMASLTAMGLNTVETYLAWNVHEPEEGHWQRLDEITDFLDVAHDAGLRTIVRPGPYICAEWDNGGLPSWLTGRVGRAVRTSDRRFLDPVLRYLDAVVPRFADHPSLAMVQVENEYGSYGDDREYLEALADALVERGVRAPLVTSDGPTDIMLTGGSLPGVPASVNFGSRAGEAFETLARLRPDSPPFCMELWCGWFDHWGRPRVTRDAEDAARALSEVLDAGGSVNLYMAHGGTNFGTGSGANTENVDGVERYRPTVTSYDYDAPLDERGAPTAKFFALRDVLSRYTTGPLPELPPPAPTVPDTTVRWLRSAPVEFTGAVRSPVPLTFEDLGVDHGLVRYETTIPGPREPAPLVVEGIRDRAYVSVDGELRAVLDRDGDGLVGDVAGPAVVSVVIESMGRVNFGPLIGETKGFDELRHGRQRLNGYTIAAHRLPGTAEPDWRDGADPTAPGYLSGEIDLAEPGDGYLDLSGWGKGYAWVDGFCLGRFWDRGPQTSLYVPWPILRAGTTMVTVLLLDAVAPGDLVLRGRQALG